MKRDKKFNIKKILLIIIFTAIALVFFFMFFVERTEISLPAIPQKAMKNTLLKNEIDRLTKVILKDGNKKGIGDLGMLYHANMIFDKAIECYSQAEITDDKNPRWYYFHAFILQRMGKTDSKTISLLKKVISLEPDYGPAILNLGDIYFKMSKFSESAIQYKKLINDDNLSKYAFLGLGRIEMSKKNLSKASEYFTKSYKKDPKFGIAYRLMAEIFKEQNKPDLVKSFRAKAKSFRFAEPPNQWIDGLVDYCFDPDELVRISDSMLKMKRIKKGIAAVERAVSLFPDNLKICRIIGNDLLSLGYFEKSIEFFNRILAKDENDAKAITNKGAALLNLSRMAEAEKYILAALKKEPNSHLVNFNAGFLFFRKGEVFKAEEFFRKTIKLNPRFARAYYNLGVILKSRKNLRKAEEYFRKSLEFKSTMRGPNLQIGVINLMLGNKERGIKFLKQELEVAPDSFRANYFLGNEYFLMKKFSDAVKFYKNALKEYPAFKEARVNLANLYELMSKYNLAADHYRFLAENFPNNVEWKIFFGKNLIKAGKEIEGKSVLNDALNLAKESGVNKYIKMIEKILSKK